MQDFIVLFLLLMGVISCQSTKLPPLPATQGQPLHLTDFKHIQSLINARCIACHSCMESPCQLNMQSWEGLRRGAFHEGVYNGLRTEAAQPTRMFQDAMSESQWRSKGFVDVLQGQSDSLLISSLRLTAVRKKTPLKTVKESLICPQTQKQMLAAQNPAELAMPYGLPPLSKAEQNLFADWVASGAPGPKSLPLGIQSLPKSTQAEVRIWERYLNAPDLNSRLVGRYLYEHLFLAHLYFKEAPQDYLKLVRSSLPCTQNVLPITSRRPNDDPGVKNWSYCFYRDPNTLVNKNHIPLELSKAKLKWLKHNFSSPRWKATSLPSYQPEVAGNPLVAFKQIPILARHRFLNQDAAYEIKTFIKGPVCNGSFAVDAIQEQFYVFFTEPKQDLMYRDPAYARIAEHQALLPGSLDQNLSAFKIPEKYYDIVKARSVARQQWAQHLERTFPRGLTLDQVWNGDGHNDNAIVTVFRHDDNAVVLKGAMGDLSKTAFLLDYSTFEKLVYNLVINFDVYGNVTHQTLSRLYMDLLRMDAEDSFLQLLPKKERVELKKQWYQGLFAQWKLDLLGEDKFAQLPGRLGLENGTDPKQQLVAKILFEHMKPEVRGPDDLLNWKRLKTVKATSVIEQQLQRLTSIPAGTAPSPFPNFFPEHSVLLLRQANGAVTTYSILRNREHQNVSWIINEDDRLNPREDTLTILRGVTGSYPNQFLLVEQGDAIKFISEVLALKSKVDYRTLMIHFGVTRMNPLIWTLYDQLEKPQGQYDLSRYAL